METLLSPLSVKVLGVGGAGLNAIHALKNKKLPHVSTLGLDTDLQNLQRFSGQETVFLGSKLTRGLSTGGNKDLGVEVAKAEAKALAEAVEGANLLFLIGSLGGGTGASILPALAKIAAQTEALVIVFAILPFSMEGAKKAQQSESSLAELRSFANALIALPNDLLLQQLDPQASVLDAFDLAHSWIYRAIRSMTGILFEPGLINLDFATLRQVFTQKGTKTLFALGEGRGEKALEQSLAEIRACPLLHVTEQSRQADNLLVQVIGGKDLSIQTINSILSFLNEYFGNGHKICLGALIQDNLSDRLEICIVGTSDRAVLQKNTNSLRSFASANAALESPKTGTKVLKKWLNLKEDKQEEFQFVSQGQVRGYFDETDRNHCDGADLDVPTYLRLGIKIRHEVQ